jgi:F-type H+-transporting ATPase subunit delta
MALRGSPGKRYAEAILELAVERDQIEEWLASLERLSGALSREVLRLLDAPSVSFQIRRQALEAATKAEPGAVRALLLLLLERRAIELIPDITRSLRTLLDQRAGIRPAAVTTAVRLDDAASKAIAGRLERSTGTRLRLTFNVDPDILGGIVVRIGDRQVDASLRTRLALLRERLATAT